MSEENVEIVRRAFAYEVYGVGDRAEAEAIFDPNVVMNPADERPSYGSDAMRSNMERWASAFNELEVTAEEFIDAGDRVLVTAYHRGRGQGSGVEVDTRFYELYILRHGGCPRGSVHGPVRGPRSRRAAGVGNRCFGRKAAVPV